MGAMADIVDDFLSRLRSLVPDLPAHAPQQLEVQLRQAWGGTEPYVGKRPTRQHAASLGSSLRAQVPLHQAFATAGVSRSTGYRTLRRR